MLKQQSNTSLALGLRISADPLLFSAHSFTKRKWDQPREQRREEKEDKSNDLTPLGLREIRNGKEEGMKARVFSWFSCKTVKMRESR